MKECKILGFKAYDEKDESKKLTGNKMIRIIIAVKPIDNSYYGIIPVPVYLKFSEELERNLMDAIDNDLDVSYETEENILTGKTRVSNLIIN